MPSTARANSCADENRSSSFGASACFSSGFQGLSGTRGGISRTARQTSSRVPSASSPDAASISVRTTPAANTSARGSTPSPRACSGAMYAGVPEIVRPGSSVAMLASPKSMTTTRPAVVIMMFSGFTSRCTSPALWIASSPARNCEAISRASCSGTGRRPRRRSASVRPSMYSIDTNSSSSAATRSKIRQTFGDTTSRADRTSPRRNSRARSLAARSARMALRATWTRSLRSNALNTSPMPP